MTDAGHMTKGKGRRVVAKPFLPFFLSLETLCTFETKWLSGPHCLTLKPPCSVVSWKTADVATREEL